MQRFSSMKNTSSPTSRYIRSRLIASSPLIHITRFPLSVPCSNSTSYSLPRIGITHRATTSLLLWFFLSASRWSGIGSCIWCFVENQQNLHRTKIHRIFLACMHRITEVSSHDFPTLIQFPIYNFVSLTETELFCVVQVPLPRIFYVCSWCVTTAPLELFMISCVSAECVVRHFKLKVVCHYFHCLTTTQNF